MKRGDVILVRFPHPSGVRGKRRPAVIVQSDAYAGLIRTLVVAEITGNLAMVADPACLYIDAGTPEGAGTGVVKNSLVSCLLLVTISADACTTLGVISPPLMQKLDDCLKAALGLP